MTTLTRLTRRWRPLASSLIRIVVLAALAGCDAPYQQFLDSIPTTEISPDQPADVFLGIDGLSRQAFDRARARGAFADYAAADLVTAFPGTSDYAWTRTMRAGALGGYELQYFDTERNVMQNDGIEGLAEHPLEEGIVGTLPCYARFDFLGNGDFSRRAKQRQRAGGPESDSRYLVPEPFPQFACP